MDTIRVTVDKSHITTIGERLYTESVELLRELVNNGYDADATEVHIIISEHEVVVSDNGTGMDLEGLKQYFNIGSQYKKKIKKTPVYKRDIIGEFGIGKFSTLTACDHFEVYTKKEEFAATVIFNKSEWEKSKDQWELPLHIRIPDKNEPDGTKVTLKHLKKTFDLEATKKRLQETLPLKISDFTVYINSEKLQPRYVFGRRIPFLEGTKFGIVHGEVVIMPSIKSEPEYAGIDVRVKQVSIKRLGFGLDEKELIRVSGEVNADFLSITSDRSGFIIDSEEYKVFEEVMNKVISNVRKELTRFEDERENTRVKRALKEIINKIEHALLLNKDWCPPGLLPVGESGGTEAGVISTSKEGGDAITKSKEKKDEKKKKRPEIKPLSPSALIRRFKIGNQKFSFAMEHFGEDRAEAWAEHGIICINRDHPLYIREAKNRERQIMHVTRLLAQEITLMSNPKNPRQAFERQSKLLKDAFIQSKDEVALS